MSYKEDELKKITTNSILKQTISLVLAFVIIFSGLTTFFEIGVIKAADEEIEDSRTALQAEVDKEKTIISSYKYKNAGATLKYAYFNAIEEAKALLLKNDSELTKEQLDATKLKLQNSANALDGRSPSTSPTDVKITTTAADLSADPVKEGISILTATVPANSIVEITYTNVNNMFKRIEKTKVNANFECELPLDIPDGATVSITALESGKLVSETILTIFTVDKTKADEAKEVAEALEIDPETTNLEDKVVIEALNILNNLFIKTKPSAGQGQIDDATKILNEALIAKATADLKASRNALEGAVKEANTIKVSASYYNAKYAEKESYDDAITAGQMILRKNDATYVEINEALDKINTANNALSGQETDKSKLLEEVNKEADIKGLDAYKNATDEEKEAYDNALKSAKEVLDMDTTLTQMDIEMSLMELKQATTALSGKADKTALKELIDSAKKLILDEIKPLDKEVIDALISAETAYESSETTQDEVDKAKKDLDDALVAREVGNDLAAAKNLLQKILEESQNVKASDAYKNATNSEKAAYDNAVLAGQKILSNPNSTIAEVNSARIDIGNAKRRLSGLPVVIDKVNKEILEVAIEDGERILKNNLPSNLQEELIGVLSEGQIVLLDYNATQAEIDRIIKKIRNEVLTIEKYLRQEKEKLQINPWILFSSYETTISAKLEKSVIGTKMITRYINGYEDGSFKPEGEITRGEAAVMYARLLTDNNVPKEKSTFEDGSFKPDETITRAEAVTMLNRLFKRSVTPDNIATVNENSITKFSDTKNHWAEYDIISASNTREQYVENGNWILVK